MNNKEIVGKIKTNTKLMNGIAQEFTGNEKEDLITMAKYGIVEMINSKSSNDYMKILIKYMEDLNE